jgi:Rrf2 family nitric oxide-sensitive transcriptional repressor
VAQGSHNGVIFYRGCIKDAAGGACLFYRKIMMQLTQFTDLGLRVLLYVSYKERAQPATIGEIAASFDVSRNHLVKVVHFMAQQGWLLTTRGKGGGLALAHPLHWYRLGSIIQTLEELTELVNCAGYQCRLQGKCQLKGILNEALAAMFAVLDRYTLADAVAEPSQQVIVMLNQLGMKKASAAMPEPV